MTKKYRETIQIEVKFGQGKTHKD